jgi:hypothetical protein
VTPGREAALARSHGGGGHHAAAHAGSTHRSASLLTRHGSCIFEGGTPTQDAGLPIFPVEVGEELLTPVQAVAQQVEHRLQDALHSPVSQSRQAPSFGVSDTDGLS